MACRAGITETYNREYIRVPGYIIMEEDDESKKKNRKISMAKMDPDIYYDGSGTHLSVYQ